MNNQSKIKELMEQLSIYKKQRDNLENMIEETIPSH
jgi:hypothetical protein